MQDQPGRCTAQAPPISGGAATPWIGVRAPHAGAWAGIFANQLRRLVVDWRCHGSACLLVATMLLAATSARARYQRELMTGLASADTQARALAGITLDRLAELPIPAIKPAWRLTLVADGGQALTPDLYSQALSPFSPSEIRRTDGGNNRLPGREPFDWVFVIRIVLPLTAFLLGYDLVGGERRSGSLKLLLSYPVARTKVLTAKAAALWLCLATPLLVGAGASLLVVCGPGGIPLTGQEMVKAALVALVGLWSAAFFSALALLVSSLARDGATSLSLLAWLWVSGVIAVPALSGLLAHWLLPAAAAEETARQLAAIDQQVAREFAGRERHWRRGELASADGFAWERVSAAAELRRSALADGVRRRVLARELAQARLAREIAAVSPASLAETVGELLAGSSLERDESFIAQARAFQAAVAERVRAADRADPASPHLDFFTGYLSRRPLGGGLPSFTFHEQQVRTGLAAAGPALAVFGLETVALALACWLAFARCKVE